MKTIINEALEKFDKIEIINTKMIVFNDHFLCFCRENKCGNYNKNYSCPPKCGSFNIMHSNVKKFNKSLILFKEYEISDLSDKNAIKEIKKKHNYNTLCIKINLENKGITSLMAGAGCCDLCDDCKGDCKFPDKMFSSVSAYCIDFEKLLRKININLQYKNNRLMFMSVLFFND